MQRIIQQCNRDTAFPEMAFPFEGMQRDRFADEFEQILPDGPMVIVLDDFHLIQSDQISEFFYYFVKEFMDRIRLILISQKKVFKDENHIDEIKGMYVPFWLKL